MAKFFVSHRKSDSLGTVGRIVDSLLLRARPMDVFFDESSIEPGEAWPDANREALLACEFLLVVIGPQWLAAKDEANRRRIDLPGDWVREEIETGLREGKTVIPVLVEGTKPPRREELPDALAKLADLQAIRLRPGGGNSGRTSQL